MDRAFMALGPTNIICENFGKVDGKTTVYNVCNRKIFTVILDNAADNTKVVITDAVKSNKFTPSAFAPVQEWASVSEPVGIKRSGRVEKFSKLKNWERVLSAELWCSVDGTPKPVAYKGTPMVLNSVGVDEQYKEFALSMQIKLLSSNVRGDGLFFVRISCPLGNSLFQPFFTGPFLVTSRPRDMKPSMAMRKPIPKVTPPKITRTPIPKVISPKITKQPYITRSFLKSKYVPTTQRPSLATRAVMRMDERVDDMADDVAGIRTEMLRMRHSFEVMTEYLKQASRNSNHEASSQGASSQGASEMSDGNYHEHFDPCSLSLFAGLMDTQDPVPWYFE
jgi:hypothetical protein